MSEVKLTVSAGVRDRRHCPVVTKLEGPGVAQLRSDGREVPFQATSSGQGAVELRFVVDQLERGKSRDYTATLGETAWAAGGYELGQGETAIELTPPGADAPLAVYHFADPKAARPYWYPVPGPFGQPVTRGFPMVQVEGERQDHPHHRSLWVAFGEVNGSDNWSEQEGHGTQTHEGWQMLASGPVCAVLDEQLCWRTKEGRPVLDERRVWRVYNLPAETRIWDLEVDLSAAAGVGDVTFGDTKEGGLCSIRVATSMDVPKGRIENSAGGVDEGETWGHRAHWCGYSGPVGGHQVGIAAFCHPTSFRHPTWWHVRNYGLMTANPFGLSQFTGGKEDGTYVLPDGQTLRFRFRVYVHPGDATEGNVAGKYQDYINPPAIKVG